MSTKYLKYPTIDEIIQFNQFIINYFYENKLGDNWRKDKHYLKNRLELKNIINGCKKSRGDVYYKATFLIINLVRKHVFASANRRTAFYVAQLFILRNEGEWKIIDNPSKSKIMLGIREGDYYSFEEIENWIRTGEIHIKKLDREK